MIRLPYLRASDVEPGDHLLINRQIVAIERCENDGITAALSGINDQGHTVIWLGDPEQAVEVAEIDIPLYDGRG